MGAKTWMIVYSDGDVAETLRNGPPFDRSATDALVARLYPKETLKAAGDGDLSWTAPPVDEIWAGCFPGVSIVAAKEFALDLPSALPERLRDGSGYRTASLHAMHSVVDWFAYARWTDGKLVRSLSLSPDSGILEEIGDRLPFEEPYWSGAHPATLDPSEPYPFPFRPLELGEAALAEMFGYVIEGPQELVKFDPETVPLVKYRRSKAWWRIW